MSCDPIDILFVMPMFEVCLHVNHIYYGKWCLVTCLLVYESTLVAERVAEKKFYKILGHSVEVTLITDVTVVDDPASHVRNNIIVLDNVPKCMNDDVLMLYLDNITELDSEQNHYTIFHNNAEVVITFNVELIAEAFPAGM